MKIKPNPSNITSITRNGEIATIALIVEVSPEMADKLLVKCIEAGKVASFAGDNVVDGAISVYSAEMVV